MSSQNLLSFNLLHIPSPTQCGKSSTFAASLQLFDIPPAWCVGCVVRAGLVTKKREREEREREKKRRESTETTQREEAGEKIRSTLFCSHHEKSIPFVWPHWGLDFYSHCPFSVLCVLFVHDDYAFFWVVNCIA
jgi:hypothetical protein